MRNRYQHAEVEGSRLGIPILFGMDIIHGSRTIFPSAIGLSCSFQPELFERTQGIAALQFMVRSKAGSPITPHSAKDCCPPVYDAKQGFCADGTVPSLPGMRCWGGSPAAATVHWRKLGLLLVDYFWWIIADNSR